MFSLQLNTHYGSNTDSVNQVLSDQFLATLTPSQIDKASLVTTLTVHSKIAQYLLSIQEWLMRLCDDRKG